MNHRIEKKRWLAGLLKGDLPERTSGQQPDSQEIAAFSLKSIGSNPILTTFQNRSDYSSRSASLLLHTTAPFCRS